MILFHGTNGEKTIEKILSKGLVAFRLPHWATDLAPRFLDGVFLSTSPVAGKGGDPVSFAMGWPVKRWRGKGAGYIVVVDLPKQEQQRIKAAIPNLKVDQYIDSQKIRSFLHNYRRSCKMSNWHIFYWLTRYLRDSGISFHKVFDHLTVHIGYRHESLPPTLTVREWEGFTREYMRFMDVGRFDMASEAEVERRRQAILRRHGIQLPAYIDEDRHSRQCALCLAGVFTYDYTIDGFDNYAPYRAFREKKKSGDFEFRLENMSFPHHRIIRDQLPTILRVVEAHFAACDEQKRQRFFARYESYAINWGWTTWYKHFPPDWSTLRQAQGTALPAVWHPEFGQFGPDFDHDHYQKELRHPDMQVLTTSIPAQYIIAVIKISDNQRLLPHIRPNKKRGETLLSKLWQLTHQARKQFNGKPIII